MLNPMLTAITAENGHSPNHPQGLRYFNLVVGGGLQVAGLALRVDTMQQIRSGQIRIAFADTDANNLEGLPQSETFIMNDTRAATLLEAIETHPSRFPGWEILGDLEHKWRALGAAESLPAGLMTRRELGPLVLAHVVWRRAAALRNFLLRPVRELHQQTQQFCWSTNTSQKMLHLVVTYFLSSCGGTGSSLTMLLEDLQRHFLNTDGGFPAVRFVADILLPGPMLPRATDPQALKANTYAFFLELLARYQQRFPPLLMGAHVVPRSHRPFEQLYIYDEINLKGRVFATRDEINDMVKEVWKLRNLGVEGQEYQSRLVDYHLEYPNIFSSAGACILEFPAEQIEIECALRSGAAWIREQPLYVMPDEEARGQAERRLQDFLNRQPGLRDIDLFTRDQVGRPLTIHLRGVAGLPRQQMPQAIDHAGHRQVTELQQALAQLVKTHEAHLSTAIISEVQSLINTAGGFQVRQHYLAGLRAVLDRHKRQLQAQADQSRTERQRREERASHQRTAAWWRRLSLNYRGDYLRRAQGLLDSRANELRQSARLELVNQLLTLVGDLDQNCNDWIPTLGLFEQRLQDKLQTHREVMTAAKSVAVEWVVCRQEIEQIFQDDKDQVSRQATPGLSLTWQPQTRKFMLSYKMNESDSADQWAIVSPTGIAQHLAYFRRFWAHIRDHTVEGILSKQGKTPEAVLAFLEYQAAPLVSIDDTTQIPAEKRLSILASQTKTFWKEFVGQTGLSVVATGNPHRISLLSSIHGFNPLDGLMQGRAWKQAHKDSLASGRSPHVFPDGDWTAVQFRSGKKPAPPKSSNRRAEAAQVDRESANDTE